MFMYNRPLWNVVVRIVFPTPTSRTIRIHYYLLSLSLLLNPCIKNVIGFCDSINHLSPGARAHNKTYDIFYHWLIRHDQNFNYDPLNTTGCCADRKFFRGDRKTTTCRRRQRRLRRLGTCTSCYYTVYSRITIIRIIYISLLAHSGLASAPPRRW